MTSTSAVDHLTLVGTSDVLDATKVLLGSDADPVVLVGQLQRPSDIARLEIEGLDRAGDALVVLNASRGRYMCVDHSVQYHATSSPG